MERRLQGFTLLELLVAVSVFSVLAMMAYGGLSQLALTEERLADQDQRLRVLQLTVFRIEQDLRQLVSRSTRSAYGGREPAISLHSGVVEFTRGGALPLPGSAGSHLQRVGYVLDGQELQRLQWPVLDRAPDSIPSRYQVLDEVSLFQVRVLDDGGKWRRIWPQQEADLERLPQALEFTIETADLGRVRRLVSLREPLS